MSTATLAGGCFWCLVKPFDQWDGIKEIVSDTLTVMKKIHHMNWFQQGQQNM